MTITIYVLLWEETNEKLEMLHFLYLYDITSESDQIAESLTSVPRESPDDILKEGPPIRPEPDVLDWRPDSYWNSDGARIEAAFRDEAFIIVIYSITLCAFNFVKW